MLRRIAARCHSRTGSEPGETANPTEQGNLLKTDQRGQPRPDKEDTGGCDMGGMKARAISLET